jgi:subtilisin family serine protease
MTWPRHQQRSKLMSQDPRTARIAPLALALTLAAATTPTLGAARARASESAATAPPGRSAPGPVSHRPACVAPRAGRAGCLAIIDADARGRPLTGTSAAAARLHPYNAADLRAAYKLPSAHRGHQQTIAIVDAYDDPHAAADLAVYRKANHLPGCAGLRCLRKVNQHGGASPPRPNAGWALEESLDLDMASAICPYCHLILVEASSNSDHNLALAVDEAARLGADVISNSYDGPESNDEPTLARHYDHPGIAITVSSGDNGFGVSAPAAYPTVIAVGGTRLYRSATARGWSETAWQFAGSGCSAYVAKPPWQKDRLCSQRTVADTAAVADPDTPVAVYDTYQNPGWVAVGGTSVAAPLIAGVYALAGNAASIHPGPRLYARHRHLFDVTSGSNGFCGASYLCTAVPGYDGPTGWGTPDGIGAF